MRDKRKSLRDHKKNHRNANKASYVQKKPARKFAKTDKSKLIQKNPNFENKSTRYKIKLTLNPPTNEYGLYKL